MDLKRFAPLLDSAMPPDNVAKIMERLAKAYGSVQKPEQSVVDIGLTSRQVSLYIPGPYMRQCHIDAQLDPLPHVQIQHYGPYVMPPKPPECDGYPFDHVEMHHNVFSKCSEFKPVMDSMFNGTAFVVSPVRQVHSGAEKTRGMLLTPLSSKYVAYLDAKVMGPELMKTHWLFHNPGVTAVLWDAKDLQTLKATYGIKFRQVLLLRNLLFAEVADNNDRDLELTVSILFGRSIMTQWTSTVAAGLDKDEFDAACKLQWIWKVAHYFLQHSTTDLLRRALEKSRAVNNQKVGLGSKFDVFPLEQMFEIYYDGKTLSLVERLRLWRAMEALQNATSWNDIFGDEVLDAAMRLQFNPPMADWNNFAYEHLGRLCTAQKQEP